MKKIRFVLLAVFAAETAVIFAVMKKEWDGYSRYRSVRSTLLALSDKKTLDEISSVLFSKRK